MAKHGVKEAQSPDSFPTSLNVDIAKAFRQNVGLIRLGKTLEVRLISVESGKAAGVCVYPESDRFIMIEGGSMLLLCGKDEKHLNRYERAKKGSAVIIPAGTWHDIICLSRSPLRLCSVISRLQTDKKDKKTTENDGSDGNTSD